MLLDYNKVLEIANEINSNNLIPKEGLLITYELNKEDHIFLEKNVFYRFNNKRTPFEESEEFFLDIPFELEENYEINWKFKFIRKED